MVLAIGLGGELTIVDADIESANPDLACGGAFLVTQVVDPEVLDRSGVRQGQGVISAVVFFCVNVVTLPMRGTETALGITLEADMGPGRDLVSGTLRRHDGLRLPPDPVSVQNVLTINGISFPYCEFGVLEARFCRLGMPSCRRGDVNADGGVDTGDGIALLTHLFLGSIALTCLDAADIDDSGVLEITDAIALFNYLVRAGPTPVAPGPTACGADTTVDDLGCETFAPCQSRV